jgi:transposase-like protein
MSDRKPMTHEERRERRRQIAEVIRGGGSITDAAQMFGCTTEQVRRACLENRVKLPRTSNVAAA